MTDPSTSGDPANKKTPSLEFHGKADRGIFNFGDQTGVSNTGDSARIHQEVTPPQSPAQLLEFLRQCHAVVDEARKQGAPETDCERADQAVSTLQQAAQAPTSPDSNKSVNQALDTLATVETSFGRLAGVGESFRKILNLLGPAIRMFFGMP